MLVIFIASRMALLLPHRLLPYIILSARYLTFSSRHKNNSSIAFHNRTDIALSFLFFRLSIRSRKRDKSIIARLDIRKSLTTKFYKL